MKMCSQNSNLQTPQNKQDIIDSKPMTVFQNIANEDK